MTSLRDQQKLDGEIAPLIINVCNFSKGADGEPSLLSPDDARTLFHEFGHGLHGMLSNVTYPSLSGTSRVHRLRRAALAALRALAGAAAGAAAVRPALPDRRAAARRPAEALPRRAQIQPGLCHRRVRLLGADRSRIPHPAGIGGHRTCAAFERAELEKIGMPAEIALRHRPDPVRPHLLRRPLCVGLLQLHVVGGDGRRRVRRLRGGRRHLRSRRWQSGCTTTSIRPAARAIRRMPMSRSAAASRSPTRCCAAAACSKHQRRPEVNIR